MADEVKLEDGVELPDPEEGAVESTESEEDETEEVLG